MIRSDLQPNSAKHLADLFDYTAGDKSINELWRNANGAAMLVSVSGGQSLPEHPAPEDVMILLIEGYVEFIVDGKINEMRPGDILLINKSTLHSVNALTDSTFLLTKVKP